MATILIVDDELMNRELLRAYLQGGAHTLLEAGDGPSAVRAALEADPDLILLDILMPGADGYEVTRQLRAQLAGRFLPIVLVSALVDREARRRGLEAGADDFLEKPVDPHGLRARVQQMLRLREQSRKLAAQAEELTGLRSLVADLRALVDQPREGDALALLARVAARLSER